ncbi:MAG: hypothetical protein WD904_03365 [Dehalococcoidia bacterium]
MVTTQVFGDISPTDDYTHPLGPEENFNESMYFNFFDTRLRRGGFLRIGNRANEHYAEVTLSLFEADGTVLFNYKRPEITTNDAYDAGGMRFEPIEPLIRHRTTYDGSSVFLATPEQMSDPGKAFRENPHKKVQIDLVHEAVGPVYGTTGADRPTEDAEKGFGRAHYEQHMRVTGTVTIDGETVEIDAFGLRDHSWGPRYWQNILSYRWLTCSFGPSLNIMVSEINRTETDRTEWGVVVRDGVLSRITGVSIDSKFDADQPFHRSMKADLTLDGGEKVAVEGKVIGFIPLRNRREGLVTHIGEAMTEYTCLGQTGLGISEYLDQIQ